MISEHDRQGERRAPGWTWTTADWLFTALVTIMALYLVVLPCIAWCEAAYNISQGGFGNAGWVVLALVMALVTPGTFLLVWHRRGRVTKAARKRYRAACGCASLVGVPVLFIRLYASAGF